MIPYVLTASEGEEEVARGVADVKSLQVAQVYAEALLDAAEKDGQVEEVLEDFQELLRNTEAEGSDLRNFFASGVIGRATRGRAIEEAFGGRAHPLLVNFLLVLNDHDRVRLLPAILFKVQDIRDQRARRLPVYLHSAVPLADEQVERIRARVRESLRLEPVIETRVDPELLGGVLLRVGDWVFDGTVRRRINDVRNELLARSSHEIQGRRDQISS